LAYTGIIFQNSKVVTLLLTFRVPFPFIYGSYLIVPTIKLNPATIREYWMKEGSLATKMWRHSPSSSMHD